MSKQRPTRGRPPRDVEYVMDSDACRGWVERNPPGNEEQCELRAALTVAALSEATYRWMMPYTPAEIRAVCESQGD